MWQRSKPFTRIQAPSSNTLSAQLRPESRTSASGPRAGLTCAERMRNMYVLRDSDGNIYAVFANEQSFPTEYVDINSKELEPFLRK